MGISRFILANQLFVQFQKSEADLDYIEKRLKLDFINANHTGDGAPAEENLVGLLEYLGPIKAKHAALSTQVKEITAAHKESMDSIRSQLDGTLQLIQHFQQTGITEISALTDSEREAAELCGQGPSQNTADKPLGRLHRLAYAQTLVDRPQHLLLHQHLSSKNSGPLTLQKIKQ
ncbi:Spindle and kinetochore-associated protein 2 [Merluccius polli]|uniref:Protein FAM33A n=1 Tax=Merluccius polli TaxID=89951 RepID=A0AA47MYW1_MERPO|nr:Spindle and kinetochore-associated protein 2 [Merluccius polli]